MVQTAPHDPILSPFAPASLLPQGGVNVCPRVEQLLLTAAGGQKHLLGQLEETRKEAIQHGL